MKAFLLALASAVLFGLSLPPYNLEWLAWFALAPLLVAVQGRKPLETIGLGLVTGVVCGVLHSGWSANGYSVLWGFIPFLWMTFLFAGVATACRIHGGNSLRWIFLVAIVGVSGEWLTTFLPIPINTALALYKQTALIQIAAVTGIWGVSFLFWLVNAVIADAFITRRFAPRLLAPVFALVVLCYAFGAAIRDTVARESLARVEVAAIQDFSGDETRDIAPAPTVMSDRDAMTVEAARSGAKLIVWSEEILGAAFSPEDEDDATRTLAREGGAYLVVGHSASGKPKAYNCASLIGPDGAVLGTHHKIHLYLGESETLQPGSVATAYDSPLGKIGLEVCFDSCYTGVTRQVAAAGARLIAMPNFDPPSPRGVLHSLHGAMLPFRAVENHVGFVRSDSNGLSQIISPTGEILAQGPLYAPATVTATLPLSAGTGTFFTRFGDWFAYLCVAAVLTMAALDARATSTRPRDASAGVPRSGSFPAPNAPGNRRDDDPLQSGG